MHAAFFFFFFGCMCVYCTCVRVRDCLAQAALTGLYSLNERDALRVNVCFGIDMS